VAVTEHFTRQSCNYVVYRRKAILRHILR